MCRNGWLIESKKVFVDSYLDSFRTFVIEHAESHVQSTFKRVFVSGSRLISDPIRTKQTSEQRYQVLNS